MSENGRTDRIQSEIATLELYCEELMNAIDDFEHEARRCRDKLERAGGDSHQIARALKALADNRDLNSKELEESRRRIEALRAELAES